MIYLLLLILVTAVWGTTFVVVKDAIAHYPTLPFLAIRFALATAALLIAIRRPPPLRVLKVGAPIGLALAAGYLFQTVGLQFTSPGNSGLITGLFVVFTPLIDGAWIARSRGGPWGGTAIPVRTWLAAIAALLGTALLASHGFALPGLGDLLTVGCAIAFALHIVLLGRYAPGLPAAPLALVQMATATVAFGAGSLPVGFPRPPLGVWGALILTGVLASAVAFYIQTWAQRHLTPSRTALILATEPAWALGAAVVLAGQRLGWPQAVGAALLLLAILGHEALGLRGQRI